MNQGVRKKTFKIDCERPVIIYSNLSVVAEKLRNRAYKICIDVKKNSAGFGQKLGEVDLYGHEPNATLEYKQNQIAVEELPRA